MQNEFYKNRIGLNENAYISVKATNAEEKEGKRENKCV